MSDKDPEKTTWEASGRDAPHVIITFDIADGTIELYTNAKAMRDHANELARVSAKKPSHAQAERRGALIAACAIQAVGFHVKAGSAGTMSWRWTALRL